MFSPQTALLIIDVQKGFDDPALGPRNNPDAESHIARLLSCWRTTHRPIFHVQHASRDPDAFLHPDKPGHEIKDAVKPEAGEPLIIKHENSAFIDTDLEAQLRAAEVKHVVIVGLTTDHCVTTTTRMGANLGFDVTLISDATATFDRVDHTGKHHAAALVHEIHLASLHGEFAVILDTAQALAKAASGHSKDDMASLLFAPRARVVSRAVDALTL